ncbi:MAG TPA: biotin--[acetyl-CoA-carboxylase] ligase [Mycobacteriales bacterium]|jgi:BirA family biotin operon repressor/biotin-[acetyl-CoA-carboxylase] ligase|nr:biotin--[acetyl-CoA-carboxylase] ligase [Mycobacteriales bacterium]
MYQDLDRPPLQPRVLNRWLPEPWREVRVLESIGSTNDYVAALARAGEREGLVVVAEHQFLGRGRLDRTWTSPPRAGLTFSLLLRPAVAAGARSWLPMLLAACAAEAVAARTDLDAALKWPNDLLVGGRKVGGVLAEATGDAVVVGFGLNVSTRRDELPRDDASSLALETGGVVDRGPLLLALLRAMGPAYAAWLADPATARERYRARCDTIGRAVRVLLPGDEALEGEATDVDEAGRLVVAHDGTTTAVSAGDVVHVRPA